MARFVYAKIYCDILRHPMLRGRPDCDARLVVGLILEAKENTDDAVLHGLTADDARSLCHIKAPVAKVQDGIDYLVQRGWLIPRGEHSYEIKDFMIRQGADSQAERQSRSRDRNGHDPGNKDVTKRDKNVSRARSRNVTETSAEGEVEVEVEVDLNMKRGAQHVARAGDGPGSTPPSDLWPFELLEQLHQALGRKLLQATDQPWMAFVAQSSKYPVAQRVAAAREYLARRHKPGEHDPSYVLAMIAKGAGTKLPAPPPPAGPTWKAKGYSSERELQEAQYRTRHDLTIDQPLPQGWDSEVRNGV